MPMATIDYPMDIVGKNGNGGWHKAGKRPYRTAVKTLLACLQTYKEARLYHLCFEGQTHAVQMLMLKALVQMAHRKGIRCEWWACRELADLTKKAHIHAFILIDCHDINPWSVFNQFDDGPVAELCTSHGVNFSIFSPKDELGIHNSNTYMHLPYQGPGNKQTALGTARLADALVWLTYLYKARSKPKATEADGQLFPASRPNRKPKTSSPAASPAAEVTNIEGIEIERKSTQTQASSIGSTADQGGTSSPEAGANLKIGRFAFSGQSPVAASPATSPILVDAQAIEQDSTCRAGPNCEGGIEMTLTPAQQYLSKLYQKAVDLGLDMEAMRKYMLRQGVKRTPLQLQDELETVAGFYGYAASHAPRPVMSVKE